jgi:hypothetical protein
MRYADRTRPIPLASLSTRDMERLEREDATRSLMVRDAREPDGCSECQGWKRLPCSYCGLGEPPTLAMAQEGSTDA